MELAAKKQGNDEPDEHEAIQQDGCVPCAFAGIRDSVNLLVEQLVMLFLILTLSNGILDARFARTINRNAQERIQYSAGADITLQEVWQSSGGSNTAPGAAGAIPSAATSTKRALS